MCGRYTLLADEMKVRQAFGIDHSIEDYQPSYNIAPGQNVLAIIHDGKKKRAGYLRWGLVPSWAKDPKIGYKMINARSETAHVKPSFKNLMARKRCLIVADSFMNGRRQTKKKFLNEFRCRTESCLPSLACGISGNRMITFCLHVQY